MGADNVGDVVRLHPALGHEAAVEAEAVVKQVRGIAAHLLLGAAVAHDDAVHDAEPGVLRAQMRRGVFVPDAPGHLVRALAGGEQVQMGVDESARHILAADIQFLFTLVVADPDDHAVLDRDTPLLDTVSEHVDDTGVFQHQVGLDQFSGSL